MMLGCLSGVTTNNISEDSGSDLCLEQTRDKGVGLRSKFGRDLMEQFMPEYGKVDMTPVYEAEIIGNIPEYFKGFDEKFMYRQSKEEHPGFLL